MAVRTAVIGAGIVSNTHLSADSASPRTELVAICDLDEDRARSAASRYDIKPYFDVADLIAAEDLDLVHVCTPVQSHLPLARTAIESEIAVVIEKPITETVEEVEELQSLSEQHDVPVTVVHQGLFSPAMRKARQLIQAGELGELHAVELVKTGCTKPDEANRGNWVHDLPGGEFEEGLPHHIYPVLGVGGYPNSRDDVKVITNVVDDYDDQYLYDRAQVQYVTESGTLCNITMSSGGKVEKLLHVQGEQGSLTVDISSQVVTKSRGKYDKSSIGKVKKNVDQCIDRLVGTARNARLVAQNQLTDNWENAKEINPHYYQLDDVVTGLENGSSMPVPLEEARWTIAIIDEIRKESSERQRNLLCQATE